MTPLPDEHPGDYEFFDHRIEPRLSDVTETGAAVEATFRNESLRSALLSVEQVAAQRDRQGALHTPRLFGMIQFQTLAGKTSRYYQEIAINRTVQVVLQGRRRVLDACRFFRP